MAGYIGTKAVNLSTTGADINGNANVDGTLDVTGAFTSLGIDDNATSTAITVDASGNVGIGTASPASYGKLVAVSDDNVATTKLVTAISNNLGQSVSMTFGGLAANAGAGMGFAVNGGTTNAMTLDASGNLLVGGTSLHGTEILSLTFDGNSRHGIGVKTTGPTGSAFQIFYNSSGTQIGSIAQASASTTAYNTSSDYRLKENITPIQGAADIVKAMRPCTYTFTTDGVWSDGFIAHELQELHPLAVTGSKDAMKDEEYEVTPAVLDDEGNVVTESVMGTRSVPDYQGVDYSKLTPILTAALQEALNKIDALEARLTALEATP